MRLHQGSGRKLLLQGQGTKTPSQTNWVDQQLNLYPNSPGSKGRNTSRSAAQDCKDLARELQIEILRLLTVNNYTADEMASMLKRSVLALRPRVSELVKKGLVEDSGERGTNSSGKGAIRWQLTDR